MGMEIEEGGPVTMDKCTATGLVIDVDEDASLIMGDSRAFCSDGDGVIGHGRFMVTLCTFEDNTDCGVWLYTHAELVECVFRNNSKEGIRMYRGQFVLRGGLVTGNRRNGMAACENATVTVAKTEKDKPQTVSKKSRGRDWGMDGSGEIIGIPRSTFGRRLCRSRLEINNRS